MSSVQTPPRVGTRFPLLGLALSVLVLYAIVLATLPPNPYRFAVALAAVFATGYCALALIVGDSVPLSAGEILAFSVGLTILVTSVSALVVSIFGIPITEFAVLIIGLPIGVVAWYFRRPHGGSFAVITQTARNLFDFSEYSGPEKAIIAALLAGILIVLVALLFLSTILVPPVLSPGLTIAGPDGTPASLPTSFVVSQPREITVTALGGSSTEVFNFRIRLVPMNATGSEPFHPIPFGSPLRMDPFAEYALQITLPAERPWTQLWSISIETAGQYNVRFELLDAKAVVVAANSLPVTAL